MLVFLPSHPPLYNKYNEGKSLFRKWLGLDWVGTVLSLGMTTCLLLSLTWGGIERPWNDRVIIALFVTVSVQYPNL